MRSFASKGSRKAPKVFSHRYSVGAVLGLILSACALWPPPQDSPLVEAFTEIESVSPGKWAVSEAMRFEESLHHPQGMVWIGEHLFVSAVEILECPEGAVPHSAEAQPNRERGQGRGHLLKFDRQGSLIAKVSVGRPEEGIYHPGGIDFDGKHLWIPVAEYRPHSRSVIYRADPDTLEVEEMFEFDDHIGALVFDRRRSLLVGMSWGSREFLVWTPDGKLRERTPNASNYIDYQDCQFLHPRYMLCSGMNEYEGEGSESFAMGGLELVDLEDLRPVHQVPVTIYPDERNRRIVVTRNPMFAEFDAGRPRFYFIPEDSASEREKRACPSVFGDDRGGSTSALYIVSPRGE